MKYTIEIIKNENQISFTLGHLTGSSAATNSSSDSPRYRSGPGEGVLGKFRDSYGHLLRRRPPPPKQLSLDSGERHYTEQPRRSLEWSYRQVLTAFHMTYNEHGQSN
jgi:hypothetical protein